MVSAMGAIINKITAAASTQNQQAEVMNENLADIRRITEGTANSSQHLSEVTAELNNLASQLQGIVGRFKV